MPLVPARIGIAMAVYNDERYLASALEALARQSFRDFQLTVIDDGSTDASAAVAEGFADRVPLLLVRAAHRGRHDAKQASWAAVDEATEFLFVLDSDIALPADALEKMVALMDADPQVAAVSALARADVNRPLGRGQAFLDDLVLRTISDSDGNARAMVGGCVMLRRSALRGVQSRSDVGEDNDLSVQLREQWKLMILPGLVATHFGVPTTVG